MPSRLTSLASSAAVATLLALPACTETIELVAASDGGPNPGSCAPSGPQCNDCADNDGDGRIDGFDPECTSALDDDEGSFATGIAGDNRDRVDHDCFFDGNSGGGDDGCSLHVCCLLDLMDGACPADLQPQQFDPGDCTPSDRCIEECQPITPPGCDCFGCCSVCGDAGCFDILTNPAIAPDCDQNAIDDPAACPRCIKIDECGADCDPASCILCPGQDPDALPTGCTQECPNNLEPCAQDSSCDAGQFCATGCCIQIPQ